MDKELIEKVEKIVARQFDLVTNLTQEGYLDSLKMIAKEAIPIIAEEIKRELEGLEVWKDYGWTIEGNELESFWNKYLTGEV